jgi:transketolase C-terminal domain/subunit
LTKIHPIEDELIAMLSQYRRIVFFEESAKGGIGDALGAKLMSQHYLGRYEVHEVTDFVPSCAAEDGLKQFGLDVDGMVRTIIRGELSGGGK